MYKVSAERIRKDIETLSRISSTPPEQGITRISWTREYARGTDYIKQRMEETGLQIWEDDLGNVCGLMKGNPGKGVIVTGSHLDTVICSGAYDGIQGVACAMEAARYLMVNRIKLNHSLEIIGMVEEEGTRTGNVLTGSAYLCRSLADGTVPYYKDPDGVSLDEMLRQYRKEETRKVDRRRALEEPPAAFIEIHDEQGPVLEQKGIEIGIVRKIRGIINFEVRMKGKGGHPGTVPMNLRRDSSLSAYEVCLKASRFVEQEYNDEATITVGKMKLLPGSGNSIVQETVFSVDIRFSSQDIGERIKQQVHKYLEEAARQRGLSVEIKSFTRKPPCPLDEKMIDAVRQSCLDMGEACLLMDSGAGHDSMNFASICPTVMIFSQCAGGISHHVEEYVSEKALEKVTEVLIRTIIRLDKEI